MMIRQRIYNGLIGAFLAGLIAGLGGCSESEKTAKLRVLSESLKVGDIAEIRELIQAGADVHVKNNYGESPLFLAAYEGYVEIVKLLLTAKADVNAASKDGRTPLFMAAYKGHGEIVTALLKAGAEVNVKASEDGKEDTPLSIATERGHSEIVKLLRAHGAK